MTRTLPEGLSEITRLFLDQLESWNWFQVDFDEVGLLEGWKFLGNGASRHVFLSPGGWVYKIGESEANSDEVRASQILYMESDSTVTFPYAEHIMDLGNGLSIIRMEYVEGVLAWYSDDLSSNDYRKFSDHVGEVTDELGMYLCDLHGGNIVVRDNIPVVIDMAS